MDAESTLQDMERTFGKVKSLAGWMVDPSVVLTITTYYIAADHKFNPENLNKAVEKVKSKAGWFSPIRGNLLPIMSAFIDQPARDIDEEVDALFVKQKLLRTMGFRNTIHSYLAALLLTNEVDHYTDEAKRAKILFEKIKKHSIFPTADHNYAYAVLLARKGHQPIEHVKAIRFYYERLMKQGFEAGYHLQWMAHILSYIAINCDEAFVQRAKKITEIFNREVTIEPSHYPMISFLAIFHVKQSQLENILQLTTLLQKSEVFSFTKEMAFSMAISTQTYYITESNLNIMVPVSVSEKYILQAQQVVMIATIVSYTVTKPNH